MKATALLLATVAGISAAPTCKQPLPIVDLGYERHQALTYNDTTGIYTFQNIRYAKNPTGNLRFRAPQSPDVDRKEVRNGSEFRICAQGLPQWQGKATVPTDQFSDPTKVFNLTAWEDAIANSPMPPVDLNAQATEDCLFLDVFVPKKVFDNARKGKEAPVLVWIHGGGYVLGSKQDSSPGGYDPTGLLVTAGKNRDDMIYVGLNYRLGALGFLSSPEVRADGVFNAGMLDQRFALEWVQKNIHLFGGCKDRVTIMGESAGGGSMLLHMGAYGGHGPSPFSQAIAQSPAYMPAGAPVEGSYEKFLTYMKAKSLKEAREVDEKTAIAANGAYIGTAPAVNYLFGPVVDGEFIKQEPITAVKQGKLDKKVKVLAGHNKFEGGFFFDPTVKTESEFSAWIERSITGLSKKQVSYLADTLYAPVYDGSRGYTDIDTRQMALWGEAVIDCNWQLASEAFKDTSYAYEFGLSPGLHLEDLSYTFGNPFSPQPDPKAQDAIQTAITSFVQTGTPMSISGSKFPHWGANSAIFNITATGGEEAVSKVNATRCAWWGNMDSSK